MSRCERTGDDNADVKTVSVSRGSSIDRDQVDVGDGERVMSVAAPELAESYLYDGHDASAMSISSPNPESPLVTPVKPPNIPITAAVSKERRETSAV
jgi:hypothetical protein